MERNIIIVSTVRSNNNKNIGFAKEIERINVAFSRARCLLIVVGNKHQFESNRNYAASIANMETVSFEQLKKALKYSEIDVQKPSKKRTKLRFSKNGKRYL